MLADAIEQEPRRRSEKTADQETRGDPIEEILYRIDDLAVLADPLARKLIKTAFDEDMVDTYFMNEKDVDDSYRRSGEGPADGHPTGLARLLSRILPAPS